MKEQHQNDQTPAKVADMTFVTGLIEAVGAAATIKVAVRLGKQEEGKVRPIKVIVNSEKARNAILGSLPNLKGQETYNGVSVTEDYTITERQQIKSFAIKATELNNRESADSIHEWKVRGTPKNGLQIKKFKKRN